MKTQASIILLLALAPACGKKAKPLGDKKTACDHIYSTYRSHQDPKVWSDACMAAPDETVRCVSLIMDEGKDSDCMKAVKSPERTKLVTVLNGTSEGSAAAEAPPAAAGCPQGAWVDPKGRACVVVPKGLKPGAETPNDDHSYVQFEDASGAVNFTLLFYPSGNYDSELQSMQHTLTALDNKLVEGPIDIAGGQGRYGKAQSDSIFEAESVVKNGGGFVECNTQWHKTDSHDDWAEGCKSLAVPHK